MEITAEPGIRVAISVPSQDDWKAAFGRSLANMLNYTHSHGFPGLQAIGIFNTLSSILPNQRNDLARFAVEGGFTHQLWLDSDMEFPSDTLCRLLGHRKEVVGINAMMRRPPFKTTAQTAPGVFLETNGESTGLEKVHHLGTGVLLVETAVYGKLKRRPWFHFEWKGSLGHFGGEDVEFCRKLRKAGVTLWVDQDLSKEVGHVGTFSYRPVYAAREAME